MRYFREEDVLQLVAMGSPSREPEDVLKEAERVGLVDPVEVDGQDEDQARSFAYWMKHGDIPDWRKEQLEDTAVKAATRDAVAEFENSQTDPRELGGAMVGGGPHDFGQTVLDTRRAILAEYEEVCKVDPEQGARGQDDMFAVLIEGRINQSTDRAKVMFLGDTDFLAALLTEIWGVCERASEDHLRVLRERVEERWFKMPHPERP